jgi:hypothetical protein
MSDDGACVDVRKEGKFRAPHFYVTSADECSVKQEIQGVNRNQ